MIKLTHCSVYVVSLNKGHVVFVTELWNLLPTPILVYNVTPVLNPHHFMALNNVKGLSVYKCIVT
jgi:hypothetical protein